MARAFALALSLLIACPLVTEAFGGEAAPDPSLGESYDGRAHGPGWRDDALALPRIVLAPVRLLFRGLGVPLHHLLDWDERNNVAANILAAFSSRDGTIGVRPAFQYSLSFTPVIGLRFFDRKLLGPGTDFEVTGMTGGLNVDYAEVIARPTPADRGFDVDLRTIYNRRNDQIFDGIGYTTDAITNLQRPSRYAIDAVDAGARVTYAIRPGLYVDGDTMFGVRRFRNGINIGTDRPIAEVYCLRNLAGQCVLGTVDELRVPGFNRGTQFFRAGASVRLDSRDNLYRPSSGALIEAGADWTHGIAGDDSHYFHWHVATSAVFDVWQRSRTIVIRIEANDLEPIGYAPVPFSELVVIGGPDTFRGFRYGRFRNFSSLFAGIEYRWPVWMWMDATLFGEYGGVFGPAFEGFDFQRMVPDLGAGLRIRSSETFFARVQLAYGFGDGWQAFFSVNTGF